jgi:hypothetical protein
VSVDGLDGVDVGNGVVTRLNAHNLAESFVSFIDGEVTAPTPTLVEKPEARHGC